MAFKVVLRSDGADGDVYEEVVCESMEDVSGEEGSVMLHLAPTDDAPQGLARVVRHADVVSSEEIVED